ncbi:hypothetical protein RSSM_05369 [Rhodopirellula sallentina SM41]|uniref:Uncharacterized protein n=1 Tax=Rhodopirellula sallentina SM41 TaxID=1263870 RepID=M5U5V0_9BACT|nr:hypothetical protein RSSM_05369 [Rhodopirellula sallentina SM41]
MGVRPGCPNQTAASADRLMSFKIGSKFRVFRPSGIAPVGLLSRRNSCALFAEHASTVFPF